MSHAAQAQLSLCNGEQNTYHITGGTRNHRTGTGGQGGCVKVNELPSSEFRKNTFPSLFVVALTDCFCVAREKCIKLIGSAPGGFEKLTLSHAVV